MSTNDGPRSWALAAAGSALERHGGLSGGVDSLGRWDGRRANRAFVLRGSRALRRGLGRGGHEVAPLPTAIHTYLDLFDAELPGLLDALYITGSLSFGDWQARRSDVDFVAVLDRELSNRERSRVAGVHRRLSRACPRPPLEGVYVTWEQLGQAPAELPGLPTVRVEQRGLHELPSDPVIWLNLKQSGVRVRGPARTSLPLTEDPPSLRDWMLAHLTGYWTNWLDAAHRPTRIAASTLRSEGLVWSISGTARGLYTLATGALASKTDALAFVRERVDLRTQRLLDEALRLRHGDHEPSLYPSRRARRAEALRFVSVSIDTASDWITSSSPSGSATRATVPPARSVRPTAGLTRGAGASWLSAASVDRRLTDTKDLLSG